jgi:parallel beta-helix repeat protein
MPASVPHVPVRRATSALMVSAVVGALLSVAAPVPPSASADTPYAQDGFDRTTSSGWGSAAVGGRWSVTGGTSASVVRSSAVVKGIKAERSMRASLSAITSADEVVRAAFTVPKTKNVYFSVEGRLQSDGSAYRGRGRIDKDGELHSEVVRVNGSRETILDQDTTSVDVKPGQDMTVELSVAGSTKVTVQSKAYLVGRTVPDWTVSAVDSNKSRITRAGQVGVHAYNAKGNAKTDVSVLGFSAWPVPAAAPVAPPTTQDPPASGTSSPLRSSYGSAAVGSTSYAVPSGAVFVSTSGSDSGDGSAAKPFATVTKAITKVRSGGTVVLRGGTYHEYFIVPPGKDITVQSYPSEAVWFDGASPVTGFRANDGDWAVSGWTTHFDASPTYTKGAPDGTKAGWQFVNPEHSMAAHPDAVWVGGQEQTQVASRSAVKAGTFYVDEAQDKLYLGSDPSGKKVEASTLAQAVSLRAPGTTLRGLGFRRYADSVWQQGVITAYYPGMTLENLVVADSATAGIGIFKPGSVVRDVTITGSGQLGMQAGYADGLVVDNVKIANSNDEHFNPAPSAGGFKVTVTRGITVKNSEIVGTDGNGFWTDQSTYGIDLLNNFVHDGARWGIVLEISSTATVADNVISNNAFDGLMVADTDHVDIWNNTIVGNGRSAVALTQDTRRVEQLGVSGHDSRRPLPDTTMPWTTVGIRMFDNILAGGTGTDPILKVQAWDKAFGATDMLVQSEGNVFSQLAVGTPKYVVVWGRKGTNAVNHTTLTNYTSTSGRDATSISHLGQKPVDSSYRAVSAITAKSPDVAKPLPTGVATKIGRDSGVRHLGAF